MSWQTKPIGVVTDYMLVHPTSLKKGFDMLDIPYCSYAEAETEEPEHC